MPFTHAQLRFHLCRWLMVVAGCHVGVGSSVSGGHWSDLGAEPDSSDVAPDMYCQCKALANGHPLAALIGNERKHLLPSFPTQCLIQEMRVLWCRGS